MNRRQFTQALTALFATPALPSMAALAPAGGSLPPAAYFWADYMTRLHNRCTAEMLAPFFKADADLARALHAQLVRENVLTASGHAHPDLLARQPQKSFGQRNFNRPKSQQKTQKPRTQATQPMAPAEIRKATPQDHDAIARIWSDGWVEAHADHVPPALVAQRTPESFHIRAAPLLAQTLVAEQAGAVLGFCMVRDAEIYQMYVSPDARGTSTATDLMTAGCAEIARAGHTEASLDVISQNTRAQAFYHKMGFVSTGLHPVLLDTLGEPFSLDCVVMTKALYPQEAP